MPWREPPGIGLLRSIVDGGAVVGAEDVFGEPPRWLPPDPPLHATRTPRRATARHLVADWEEQPLIALSLYLSAYA